MSKRYGHIDELIRKAEEILDRAGKPDEFVGDVKAESRNFVVTRKITLGNKVKFSIRFTCEELLWRNQLVLTVFDGWLHYFMWEDEWIDLFNQFHAEVMSQAQVSQLKSYLGCIKKLNSHASEVQQ